MKHILRAVDEQLALNAVKVVPPLAVQREARQGLDWRREHGRGGTDVGVATARWLASGRPLTSEKVRHVARYFPRHEVDKRAPAWRRGADGYPSAGRVAWALWGGDAGWRWAKGLAR